MRRRLTHCHRRDDERGGPLRRASWGHCPGRNRKHLHKPFRLRTFRGPGVTGGFAVLADDGGGWAAHRKADWIIVIKATGSGRNNVFFSCTDSPQPAARTGTISVAGNVFQVNQDAARASTGTFEPQLVQHLTPGFYIVEASLAQGASGGFWGLAVLGQTSGGFNLGGGLAGNAASPGFAAFFLPTAQTVNATATAPLASTAVITLHLLDSSRRLIAANAASSPGSSSLQAALQPGFYIVEITTHNPAPLNYSLALSANAFSGGVDVGGAICTCVPRV